MAQQPGQGWPQEDPYAPAGGSQPPAYPQQPYGQPGMPKAPAYHQSPQPAAYAASGYGMPAVPYAPWGKRVAASVIDGVLGLSLLMAATVFAAATSETIGYDIRGDAVTQSTGMGTAAMVVGYAWMLGFQTYNRWLRQGRTGQSIGKKSIGIRLLSERTMAPIGGGTAFLRDLCHIVDGFFYLGYLWPLWDAKRQTFSDKIIETVVLDD